MYWPPLLLVFMLSHIDNPSVSLDPVYTDVRNWNRKVIHRRSSLMAIPWWSGFIEDFRILCDTFSWRWNRPESCLKLNSKEFFFLLNSFWFVGRVYELCLCLKGVVYIDLMSGSVKHVSPLLCIVYETYCAMALNLLHAPRSWPVSRSIWMMPLVCESYLGFKQIRVLIPVWSVPRSYGRSAWWPN
jgi:hypothetical protein